MHRHEETKERLCSGNYPDFKQAQDWAAKNHTVVDTVQPEQSAHLKNL